MSLFKQLLIAICLFLVVAFSGSFMVSLESSRTQYVNQLRSHAQDAATALALSLTPNIDDPAMVELLVSSIFDSGYYASIRVVDLATDKTIVLGTATLLAGAVVHVSEGDYSIGTSGNMTLSCGKDANRAVGGNLDDNITGNASMSVGGTLTEKITGIRRSVAQAQQLIAPVVKLGTDEINVLTLLTDTLTVVNELAKLVATHTHPSTGASQQAAQFTTIAGKTDTLRKKYAPLIA